MAPPQTKATVRTTTTKTNALGFFSPLGAGSDEEGRSFGPEACCIRALLSVTSLSESFFSQTNLYFLLHDRSLQAPSLSSWAQSAAFLKLSLLSGSSAPNNLLYLAFLSDPSPFNGYPCLVDLIDVTLACDTANSKLVEVVTVADVDAGKRVDVSLVQILKLKFGQYFAADFWLRL